MDKANRFQYNRNSPEALFSSGDFKPTNDLDAHRLTLFS